MDEPYDRPPPDREPPPRDDRYYDERPRGGDRGRGDGAHPKDHVFQILFDAEYDLAAFLPPKTAVILLDGSDRHGWQAKVVGRVGAGEYKVRLCAERSVRGVPRAVLRPRLESAAEGEGCGEAQLEEEQRVWEEKG